jgi:DNA polymerase III alpha subunit (gram-positive type)
MDNTKKEILVIDIETTGFMSQQGSIVEVGVVALNLESGNSRFVFDSVCREKILSERHRKEPMGWIFKNSTLTIDEVREAPDLDDLLPRLQTLVDDYPLGATAYNRNFDFDFLEDRGLRFPRKLPCPMLLSTPICKLPSRSPRFSSYKWPSVEEAWKHFFPEVPYDELHRGADDAAHEARIVFELYKLGVFRV